MAATAQAQRLTEAHRLAQARLGAQTVQELVQVWPLLDVEDLDSTTQQWLRVAIPLVLRQRTTSARLAANYLTTFRAIELGVESPAVVPTLAERIPTDQIATSLVVTGPAKLKSAVGRGAALDKAVDLARAASAAAGMRHSVNGGRETITATIESDNKALGWARTTSGQPCHFCAMVASRGPVYKDERSGDFEAHDHCACGVEPVYRRDASWPSGAQRYADLWQKAKQMDGDATTNFRRLYEDRAA